MDKLQQEELLETLKKRFLTNMKRHTNLTWDEVVSKLAANPSSVEALHWMETTEGEPDVIGVTNEGQIIFVDCSKETPKGRRSTCFDEEARLSRKKFPPEQSVESLIADLPIKLLSEEDYRYIQALEEFDVKTSSWIETPEEIRKLGGALFADRRYNTVFIYHNGADSYYSSRAFRVKLCI